MSIINYPNKYIPKDNKEKIFIYLAGDTKQELIDYILDNIKTYLNNNIDKIIFFYNPSNNINNQKDEEIEDIIKWENEIIIKSDIFTIFFDENNNNNNYYQLGRYLSFFHEIYNESLSKHFIISYKKDFKNLLFLKTQIKIAIKDLLEPIEINEISEYSKLILNKLKNLYEKTDQFIKHEIVRTPEEIYWSTNLNKNVKKVFCQSPWPKSQIDIGILGKYGVGKTKIYIWFAEGRYARYYNDCIGGNSHICQVEINNKKFIVNFEDTGSQEKFCLDSLLTRYTRNKNCIIFVFDITDRNSFDLIKNKCNPLNVKSNKQNNLYILVGNKSDLKFQRTVSYEEADFLADKHKMKYFEVSVKSGENMQRLCNFVYFNLSNNLQ